MLNIFFNCISLTSVISPNTTPPVIKATTFDETTEQNAALIVPADCENIYRQHPYWENFDKIEAILPSNIQFALRYIVNGDDYKTYNMKAGEEIKPEKEPIKEGYTFSGWSEIPSTMPAKDVTVTGIFEVNTYTLTYVVDGETYKTVTVNYGDAITPEAEPTKEGYTFSGWSEIPATMPAKDVTIIGHFTFIDAIEDVIADNSTYQIYTIDGKPVEALQKGVNIIRMSDGTTKKVYVK